MANIPGTNVIAPIVPFSTDDIFASHLAKYGHGGWRTAEDLNERDSIKELRREELMVCAVMDDSYNSSTAGDTIYILDINHDGSTSSSLMDNNNWIPLNFGAGDDWILPPPPRSFYTGEKGQRSYDDDFLYICIQDNVWKRIAYDFFVDGVFDGGTSGTSGVLPDGVVPIWDDGEFIYDLVVKNVTATTSGEIKVTYTNGTFVFLPVSGTQGIGDNWILPPPLSSASLGFAGQRSYDSDFIYICVEDDLWKRINLDLFLFSGSTSGESGGLMLPNGVVPIWNDTTDFFEYGLVVNDTDISAIDGTNFLNVYYTDNTTASFKVIGGTANLSDLNDVILNSPTLGESLVYNGTNWENQLVSGGATSSGASTLNELLDVVVPSPIINDYLKYSGTDWVNTQIIIPNHSTAGYLTTYNDYTTAGLATVIYSDAGDTVLQNQINNLESATTGINTDLDSLQTQIDNLPQGNDYTTAGLASIIYSDAGDTALQVDIDALESATTGINTDLDSLQSQIDNLDIKDHTTAGYLTTYNDYTTAGLATTTYSDTGDNILQNQIDSLESATTGINQRLDELSSIDSLKAPDAFSPVGLYPTTYYSSVITAGDTWRIANNGTMGTVVVNPEDLLIALADVPAQTESNFMVVESNRDQATELFLGVAKIATTGITLAGTNDTDIVTPLKLQQKIDSLPLGNDYTTAGLATIIYSDTGDTALQVDIDSLESATTGINTDLDSLQTQIDNLPIGKDHATAGYATIIYSDTGDINIQNNLDSATNGINTSLDSLQTQIDNLPQGNNYTTAGLATIIYSDAGDTSLQIQIDNLDIKDHTTAGYLTSYNDYTTAGLATIIYSDAGDTVLQNQIDSLESATTGINTDLDSLQTQIDNLPQGNDYTTAGLASTSSLADYVPIAGGTMTGDLFIDKSGGNETFKLVGSGTVSSPQLSIGTFGDTIIQTNSSLTRFYLPSTGLLLIQAASASKTSAVFDIDGEVGLRYDSVTKFETTTSGVDIFGEIKTDSITTKNTVTDILVRDTDGVFKVRDVNTIGNDYTTAGLATIIYSDAGDNALQIQIDNLPTGNDHTTAGYATITYSDLGDTNLQNQIDSLESATTGINTDLDSLQTQIDNLPTVNDYTTAGLASSSWVNNNFVTINNFDSATTGINDELNNILSKIDNVYYTALNTVTYNVTNGNPANNNNLFSTSGANIGSTIIPANSLEQGDTFKVDMVGYFTLQNATSASFRIKLGGATLASISSININSQRTDALFESEFLFTVRSTGVSGSVIGQGYIDIGNGTTGASNPLRFDLVKTSTTTIDTTSPHEMTLEFDWDTNFQGSINITNSKIEK